jgi:hypothetical protein
MQILFTMKSITVLHKLMCAAQKAHLARRLRTPGLYGLILSFIHLAYSK